MSSRHRDRRAAALCRRSFVVLVALLVITGCSSETSDRGEERLRPYEASTHPSGDGTGAADRLLPMQQYLLRGRDYDTVMRAVTVLAQQCMDRQGFTIRLPAPPPAVGAMVDISLGQFGVPSLEHARRYGYVVPPDARSPVADDDFSKTITPAENTALIGSTLAEADAPYRNGCTGEADRALMGDASAIMVGGIMTPPLVREVTHDPRAPLSAETTAAMAAFAVCMRSAGYPEVTDVGVGPREFAGADTITKGEIRQAIAQVRCQDASGVSVAMRRAEVAFQLRAIDANPEAFAQIKAELAAVVRRATAIVGDH